MHNNSQLLKAKQLIIITSYIICLALDLNAQVPPSIKNSFLFKDNISKITEKIYLQIDRNIYTTGEDIYFKAFYENGINSNLIISKILNIDIVSNSGEIVSKNRYRIDRNCVNGSLKIINSLKSGRYKIYAYTNWQKNLSSSCICKEDIIIINHTQDIIYSSNESDKKIKSIQFFPERNKIISEQNNLITFKVFDGNNNPINASGQLIDNQGSFICKVKTIEEGFGYFNLQPQKNTSYEIIFDGIDTSHVKFKLPAQETDNIEIEFNNSDNQNLTIVIKSTDSLKANSLLKIEIENNGLKYYSLEDRLYKGICVTKLDKRKLKKGVNQLRIYNQDQNKIFERYFFNSNTEQGQVKIKTNKPKYKKREKVFCEINVDESFVNKENIVLSVSVAKKELFTPKSYDRTIKENNFYVNDSSTISQLDNLLLSLNLPQQKFTYNYLPETRGVTVKGLLLKKRDKFLVNNRIVILSTIGEASIIQNAMTNKDGQFVFSIENLFGEKDFAVQLSNTVDTSTYDIYIENENIFLESADNNIYLDKKKHETFQNMVTSYLISKRFEEEETKTVKQTSKTFYDKPDKVYLMEDYVEMPTMEEFIFEILEEVLIYKKKDSYEIRVLRAKNFPLSQKPLILIDGYPIFNIDDLLKIKPSNIEKVEVVNTEYILGDIIYGGIINFRSLNTDFGGLDITKSAILFNYQLLSEQKQFKNKIYTTNNIKNRTPDYRNTLYWNHELTPIKKGYYRFNFFTSDESGRFIVNIKGLKSSGEIISTSCEFVVE